MNPNLNAVRAGLRRGLTEFWISMRTPSESSFMLIGIVAVAVVFWLQRGVELMPGVPTAAFIVPSVLTIQLLFVACYGLATVVVTEREDGTLIRARTLPTGLRAYTTGLTTRTMAELVVTVGLTLVIVAALVGPELGLDAAGIVVIAGMFVLGTIALTTFGMVIGTMFRNPRSVGGWGFFVLAAFVFVSGLIQPLASLPVWVQVIGVITPIYWIGHGMREAFLPPELAMLEIGGEWQLWLAFAVVGAWAVVGAILAPMLLRRVARRETASALGARREAAMQRA
ncbi:ABC transporter permease [Agromyces silvae]|uniref:ABC transporter permease n=1 Tax=Agromyces silvae TaxID=3388266 RepID=UPI00280BA484|nr:ABC transporter permease [Agromyces protaetiae]